MKWALFLLLAAAVPTLNAPANPADAWNVFARDANEWAKLRNSDQRNVINAREIMLWNKMKEEWPEVRKSVDKLYQGY